MDEELNGGADSQQGTDEQKQQQQQQPNLGAIRKSGQQEVLNVFSKISGQTFNSTKEAADFFEAVLKQHNGGSEQPTKKPAKDNGEIAELRQMIQSLHSTIQEKEQTVRKTSLQSQIKDAAIKNGFDPSMMDVATSLFEQQISFDDDGSFYVKGQDGNVKLDQQGNPYTLDALAKDILKSRPKFAVEEQRTGTGSKFGMGPSSTAIPNAAADMEGWKKWKQENGLGTNKFKGLQVTVNKPKL